MLKKKPAESHGNRAQKHAQHHAAVGIQRPFFEEPGKKVLQHPPEILPEVDNHRHQGTHMNGDIKYQSLIRPAQKPRGQNKMGGAGDRKKFGKPLNHRQNKRLKKIHDKVLLTPNAIPVPDAIRSA